MCNFYLGDGHYLNHLIGNIGSHNLRVVSSTGEDWLLFVH